MKDCFRLWAVAILATLLAPLPQAGAAIHHRVADRNSLAVLAHSGQIKVVTIGTGETIGHVGDLRIQNLTSRRLTVPVPAMVLESASGRSQDYACFQPQDVVLEPDETKTIPIDGVCLMRDKPPVGKGVTGEMVIDDGNPASPPDPKSHLPPKAAGKLERVAKSCHDAAHKLRKKGTFKHMPYTDPETQEKIATQWSVWSDPTVAKLTGSKPATKEDLKKTITHQAERKHRLTTKAKEELDSGVDEIFKDVQLTGKEAKNLEEPDPFANVELTGPKAKAGE